MYHKPHIFVNDEILKATDSFTYLGSTLSREANINVEVNKRLSKANYAFGRLRKKVWDRRGISQETKLKVYMAVVLTVLLYACKSWTVYSHHARKLNHFHTKCLRIILSIKWQDMVPDTEVLTRAGIPSIHTLLQKAQVTVAYPGGFSGCQEPPPPAKIFLIREVTPLLAPTLTSHLHLRRSETPLETNSGYATE